MSAMRSRSITLGFLLLLLWATVTYFLLFHHSPDTDNNKKQKIDKQINELEKEINQLLSSNSKLIQDLKKGKMKINYDFRNASLKDYLNINKEKNLDKTQNSKTKFLDDKNSNVKTVPPLNPQNSNELMNNLHLVKHKNVITKLEDGTGLPVIAVLVISCNRITVRRCIDQLLKYRPNEKLFPIIVSQDCSHQQTTEVIRSYGNKIIHIQQPDQSDIEVAPRQKNFKGYFKIARHYGWALNQIFLGFGFDTAIVVEDDLDIAPDFFEYFLGTHSILTADSSLWCISAWNDNGKAELVDSKSPHLLYRTDFFPGLGWMLTRKLWEELSVKWPKSYWDDWIRQPEQRKNRACIRPEISRTRTFGKIGVSNGLFYEKHLQFIKLNDQFVPFTKMNLTYLLKENYDLAFVNEVYKSEVVTYADLKMKITTGNTVRIPYYTRQFYKSTAKILGLMDDFKSGVPRTGYRGVVTFFYNGRRVYLAPSASWSGYDISWS